MKLSTSQADREEQNTPSMEDISSRSTHPLELASCSLSPSVPTVLSARNLGEEMRLCLKMCLGWGEALFSEILRESFLANVSRFGVVLKYV